MQRRISGVVGTVWEACHGEVGGDNRRAYCAQRTHSRNIGGNARVRSLVKRVSGDDSGWRGGSLEASRCNITHTDIFTGRRHLV